MAVSLASLLVTQSKATIYKYALALATSLGLPVSSWQPGDPTRSLYHLESQQLASLETLVVGYIASGFLDYATGDWLKILAKQVFNVDVPEADYATTDVVLTNGGGGLFVIEAGDLTFENSTTGKTYRNTTGGTLASGVGQTLTLTVEAEEAGSDSSAASGEIDTLITTLLRVTCTNPTAAVGTDEQDEDTTRQQCRDKLASLSPNGPKEAYSYVSRNRELSLASFVPRVRVYSDSDDGTVTVYLAGPSGPISEDDRVLFDTAMKKWATPLCIKLVTTSATAVVVPVTYSLSVYKSANKTTDEIEELVEDALEQLFASRYIGGDALTVGGQGYLYKALIESTIRSVLPEAFNVTVSAPTGDTALAFGEVATLGTVTPTIALAVDP